MKIVSRDKILRYIARRLSKLLGRGVPPTPEEVESALRELKRLIAEGKVPEHPTWEMYLELGSLFSYAMCRRPLIEYVLAGLIVRECVDFDKLVRRLEECLKDFSKEDGHHRSA